MISDSDRADIVGDVIKHFEANPPAPRKWYTTAEAATYLRLTPGALHTLRSMGTGPDYYRPTWRLVRYCIAALDKYLEDHPERRDGANPRKPGDPPLLGNGGRS